MCLAVPGQITTITDLGPVSRTGIVAFGGILKEVNLSFVPEAAVGDYVVVHVGVAISRLDETEALRVFEYLEALGELDELEAS